MDLISLLTSRALHGSALLSPELPPGAPHRPFHPPWVWAYTAIHLQAVMCTITDNSLRISYTLGCSPTKIFQATCSTFLFSAMLPAVLCCFDVSVCIALSDYMHERCVVDMNGFENVSVKNLPHLTSGRRKLEAPKVEVRNSRWNLCQKGHLSVCPQRKEAR